MAELIKLQTDEDKKNMTEQYKILIESINKLNNVRESSNNWWTTINGALLGVISYFRNMQGLEDSQKQMFLWTIVIVGFVLCYTWLSSIFTIKKGIDIRNRMLMEFEKHLPAQIFTLSIREIRGEISKGSLSTKEAVVPILFLAGYTLFAFMLYFYPHISHAI